MTYYYYYYYLLYAHRTSWAMGRAKIISPIVWMKKLKLRGGGAGLRSRGAGGIQRQLCSTHTHPGTHSGRTLQLDDVLGAVLGVHLLVVQRGPGAQCGLCDGKLRSDPCWGQWDPAQRGQERGWGAAVPGRLAPDSLGVSWAVHPGASDQSAHLLPQPSHCLSLPRQCPRGDALSPVHQSPGRSLSLSSPCPH